MTAAARLGLVLVLFLGGMSVAAAGPKLRLVSDVAAMEGRQVQSPSWAPGDAPKLVHELTDRDRSTWLRVVQVEGSGTRDRVVPGSRSSRLEAMGAGSDRADSGAAWWDAGSFFFIRSVGGDSSLYYYDGTLRAVPGIKGRVEEVAADMGRSLLYATVDRQGAVDLFELGGVGFAETQTQFTRSPGTVEHGLEVVGDGGGVLWVGATRTGTRLGRAVPPAVVSVRERVGGGALAAYEILSIAAGRSAGDLLAYARLEGNVAKNIPDVHVLLNIAVDSTMVQELVRGVYLPPGLAPKPAVVGEGNSIYYIAADEKRGNPVLRFDRQKGTSEVVNIGTVGNQEVAVAEFGGSGQATVPWIAVVSVGDATGQDVRNHLYIGPLGPWPEWSSGN